MLRFRFALLLLLALPLLGAGCPCLPGSDTGFCALLEVLTQAAFGTQSQGPPPPANTCPASLVCLGSNCIGVGNNGGFEDPIGFLLPATSWYGDKAETGNFSCRGPQALTFVATTPDGPSASASAQVYQVIDYNALVPAASRATLRRVRAQGAFQAFLPFSDDDLQFGLRIDAYAGDPATFPTSGDPETFPQTTATYQRLTSTEATLLYNDPTDESPWLPLHTELLLPAGTDFFVVLLEAFENVVNEDDTDEFGVQFVDNVQIVIDAGNTPPVARPDRARTLQDTPVNIPVRFNDQDNTSRLDLASVVIVQPPASGTAAPAPDGRAIYTPSAGFVGTDTFTYTIADEEGLRSNEAVVTVEVANTNDAPTAQDDTYDLPAGGLLIVPGPIGVLANDTDADGDTLTAVLVTDAAAGTLTLDPTGAFTYQAGPTFSGTDTFTYRASDGIAASGEATVTITAPGYDLALTQVVDPATVGPSGEATFAITVTNNGPGTATGIDVTDQFPDFETTVTSIRTTQGTYTEASARWDVGDLAAGERATLAITALIHLTVTNTATITAGLADDTNPNNNSAAATVTVTD